MNDAGIRYLVVGGVAVNLHGYRRFTADVDILLALDEENVKNITVLMHDMGYVERLPVELRVLADGAKLQRLIEEKGMTAYTFLSNKRDRIDLDVLAGASLGFDDYNTRKLIVNLDEGLKVPVVSLDDLLAMKRAAHRSQDVRDIEVLLQLKGL